MVSILPVRPQAENLDKSPQRVALSRMDLELAHR